MDYQLTQDEARFKEGFLAWLDENLDKELVRYDYQPPESWSERAGLYRDFQKKLFRAGYAGITYPKSYGGRDGSFMEQIIVAEALAPWDVNVGNINGIGHGMAAPTILTCGTEEQKAECLPKLLNGDHIWCQAFSEPNAGSDVAGVATRATRDGNDYVLNGQKVWISLAHVADYCILLARTDHNVSNRHMGLSYFILDMRLPGVEVRPLTQMTGEAEFNEIYLNDVRVSESMRIGQEGEGWKIALTTLMFERVVGDVSMTSALWWLYDGVVLMARKVLRQGRPAIEHPMIRQKLTQCFIDLTVTRQCGYRSVSKVAAGGIPGPEGSMGKLLWSELYQRLTELAMEIQGRYHQLTHGSFRAIDSGRWQYFFLRSKGMTIGGGTSEIQRNIIGERVLGLPR